MAASLLFGLGACGTEASDGDEIAPSVSDSTYVAVMIDLLLLDAEAASGDAGDESEVTLDSARAEALAKYGVTAQQMIDFADVVGRDPGRMELMWRQITNVFDSVRSADLRRQTEARSEAEGDRGPDASTAADRLGGAMRQPAGDTGADSVGRARPQDARARRDSVRRARGAEADPKPGS